MVKRFRLTDAERFPRSLEVADEFFLLCIYAEDEDAEFRTPSTYVHNMDELRVPLLGIVHREVLEELPVAEVERIKYLADMTFGELTPLSAIPFRICGTVRDT